MLLTVMTRTGTPQKISLGGIMHWGSETALADLNRFDFLVDDTVRPMAFFVRRSEGEKCRTPVLHQDQSDYCSAGTQAGRRIQESAPSHQLCVEGCSPKSLPPSQTSGLHDQIVRPTSDSFVKYPFLTGIMPLMLLRLC